MTTSFASTGDAQTYEIIGAAMDVYNELGCGFLEGVYREPFAIELARRVCRSRRSVLPIDYKGQRLRVWYRVDLSMGRPRLPMLGSAMARPRTSRTS